MKQAGLLGWLQKPPELSRPRRPWLPDPNGAASSNARVFPAANVAVEMMLDKDEMASKQKRGSYHAYFVEVKAKIAKLTEKNGLTMATLL